MIFYCHSKDQERLTTKTFHCTVTGWPEQRTSKESHEHYVMTVKTQTTPFNVTDDDHYI